MLRKIGYVLPANLHGQNERVQSCISWKLETKKGHITIINEMPVPERMPSATLSQDSFIPVEVSWTDPFNDSICDERNERLCNSKEQVQYKNSHHQVGGMACVTLIRWLV